MKLRNTILALGMAALACVTASRAQGQSQGSQQKPAEPMPPMNQGLGGGYSKPPAPAARGVDSSADTQGYTSQQVLPDQNTLSGAEMFSVGSLQHSRNIFDPAFSISELGVTGQNPSGLGTTTSQGISSETLLGGSMSFDRSWDIFHMTAVYNGGETLYEGPVSSHFQFHNLAFAEQANFARWHLLLRDDLVASSGAAFTGTGMGGPGLVAQFSSLLGASLSNVGQSFTPTETIETGTVMRYMDTVLGQAEYSFSRRSAVTFAGSYGLLDFSGPGFISSNMFNVQAGYDYLLDPTNSIAVLGSYGKIDYTGTVSSTTSYTAAFAYGRKITGRLAFQAAIGPQDIVSRNSISGVAVLRDVHLLNWFASSGLTYNRRRSGVSLSYSRGATSGSGVFLGALTNTVTGSAHYQFTRNWTGSVSGGYAVNNSLEPAGFKSIRFDNWFIGANLARTLGHHAQINFNYGLQKQNIPATCPVASCGISGFQQTFGSTINWHLRKTG